MGLTGVEFHHYRAEELFTVIFGGANRANRQVYQQLYKLMVLSLVIMPSNAEAERAFSVQNRTKTRLRSCLSAEQLDRLIRLAYHQVPLAEFNFQAALARYMAVPHRWY